MLLSPPILHRCRDPPSGSSPPHSRIPAPHSSWPPNSNRKLSALLLFGCGYVTHTEPTFVCHSKKTGSSDHHIFPFKFLYLGIYKAKSPSIFLLQKQLKCLSHSDHNIDYPVKLHIPLTSVLKFNRVFYNDPACFAIWQFPPVKF